MVSYRDLLAIDQQRLEETVRRIVAEELESRLPRVVRRALGKRWVTARELAELTGLSERQIRYLQSQGRLPHSKVGRRVLFDLERIEELIAKHEIPLAWKDDR